MLSIRRAGSFDGENGTDVSEAIRWAMKYYGPTPSQLARMCSCPACRAEQEVNSEDRAAFFRMVEERRTALLHPTLMFNEEARPFKNLL
tara:strand:- start:735 stop:1001 length:267 start_codon:yes stop_codon:yes gene_type:complete